MTLIVTTNQRACWFMDTEMHPGTRFPHMYLLDFDAREIKAKAIVCYCEVVVKLLKLQEKSFDRPQVANSHLFVELLHKRFSHATFMRG